MKTKNIPTHWNGALAVETAEAGTNNCPECGQPGKPVETKTLKHTVQPLHLELVNKPGFLFCRSADCDMVYFHPDGDCLRKPDVRVRVGLKETEDPVPICYFFGFTKARERATARSKGGLNPPRRTGNPPSYHHRPH